MSESPLRSSRNEPGASSEGGSQVGTAIPLLGAGILWLLLSNRFPLVETRYSDVLLLILVALVVSALWTFPRASVGPLKGSRGLSFLWTAALLGLLLAGVAPTLNAVLDKRAAHVFTTVVNTKHCYKRTCTWELRGVDGLPVNAPTMSLQLFRTLRAEPGDPLVPAVKPGVFGRAWIASREVHHVERSRLACARLAVSAANGDTIQLGRTLAEGLSIESEEPGLDCQAPLMVAAGAGQGDVVAYLLRRGANPNHAAPDGQTPLMNAVRAGSIAAVQILIAHGADPQAIARPEGLTTSVMGVALEVGDTAIIGVVGRAMPRQGQVRASGP